MLKAENSGQISGFLASHADAEAVSIMIEGAKVCEAGLQLLPNPDSTDGFYYALLRKRQ